MLFNSFAFLLFFPIVTVIYFLLPNRAKQIWLLGASYFFYMCWNAKYVLLLLFSTLVTYGSGLLMDDVEKQSLEEKKKQTQKKWVVALSFTLNILILFFFKYYNFFLSVLERLFALAHVQLHIPTLDVLLPVGISFYIFQALSYTMDVYRHEIPAEKNFIHYALFVSFFPQLVAGPIERSKNLIHQVKNPRPFDYDRAKDGFALMIWGYFLKLVIADRAALLIDTVYGDIMSYPGWYLVVATVLFAVQIYSDFAGYSTIAIGAAKILGMDLMENFNVPYYSTSVSEFWRRWHISLSSWFRDYLYIPLGGSRKGTLRKYFNLMIVFLVSGLWHGASLSFVVWGGLNGLYQIIEDLLKRGWNTLVGKPIQGLSLLKVILTFVLIDLSWVFFRASRIQDAIWIFKSMFTANNFHIFQDGSIYQCGLNEKNFWLLGMSILLLGIVDLMKKKGITIRSALLKQPYLVRCAVLIFAICFVLIFGIWGTGYDTAGFIYFQF